MFVGLTPTHILMSLMKSSPWALVLAVALVAGCSKGTKPPTAEELARRRPPSPADAGPPNPVVIPDAGDPKANLEQLSLALRRYVAGTHRMPKDFDDFVAKSGVQPPPPPTGQKYAIQGLVIALVKQ